MTTQHNGPNAQPLAIDESNIRAFVSRGCTDAYIARCFGTTEAHIKRLRRSWRVKSEAKKCSSPELTLPSLVRKDPDIVFARVRFEDDPAAVAECRPPATPDYPVMKAMR